MATQSHTAQLSHLLARAAVTPGMPRRNRMVMGEEACPTLATSVLFFVSPATWVPHLQENPAPGSSFFCCPVGAGGNDSHSCVSVPSADSGHVLDLRSQGTFEAGQRPRALPGSWQAPGLYESPRGSFVLCDLDNGQHSQTARHGSALVKGPGLLTLRLLSSGGHEGRSAPGVPTHIHPATTKCQLPGPGWQAGSG